jgi:hypothetical protein
MRPTSSWCGRRTSGVTESKVKAKPHNKTEDLIQKIKEVIGYLEKDTVAKACNSFKLKIENVVTADSDLII